MRCAGVVVSEWLESSVFVVLQRHNDKGPCMAVILGEVVTPS
jgi:hypothetical protein